MERILRYPHTARRTLPSFFPLDALIHGPQGRLWIEVHPDHFYHAHFYPAYLRNDDLSPEGRRLIDKAFRESGRTVYLLFDKLIPLDGAP